MHTGTAYAKLDPTLRSVVESEARRAELRDPQTRDRLPFEVEVNSENAIILPLFIATTNAAVTAEAIRTCGGTVSVTTPERLVARVPLSNIEAIAGRPEVVRLEPSWKRRH